MVLNPNKCHFLTLGVNKPLPDFSFENVIKNATREKILGIVIDNNLNFKSHMKKTYEKANQKLSAIVRIYQRKEINRFFY